jgi:exodeoxyribonuclease V gamma subunit
VQFATLMPMRSIPFKIVCLLGMNDQDYPRHATPRDFDLMAKSWRAGDRSRREDDRYLFLEAILSARQKLYISWQGHRATDHAEQPPSVLVSQLQDVLQARFADAPQAQQQPLQPFSKVYFEEGSEFSTYASDWQLAMQSPGGETFAQASHSRVPAHSGPWITPPSALNVEALQRFLRQPVEVYWRQRMDVHIPRPEEAVPEDEPFALDSLAQYLLGQDLLQGESPEAVLHDLQAQGRLPLAAAGQRLGQSLLAKAQIVRERAQAWQLAYSEVMPVYNVDLHCEGFHITGAVRGLWQGRSGCLQMHMRPGAISQGKPRHPRWEQWVDLWVGHVMLCAMGRPVQSVLLGIDGECHMPALHQPDAQAQLRAWLLAYQQAWQAPLPVALRTALAYLHAVQRQNDSHTESPGDMADEWDDQSALLAASDAFEGSDFSPGERQRSAYLQRSFVHADELAEGLRTWAQSIYGGLIALVQFQGERDETVEEGAP